MPAMNLQIVWSIHVCIKLVRYCLEWKTLQLCGWLLPISCLRSLKRKSSLESSGLKHIVYCTLALKKSRIQKGKAVVKLPTLLRKLKCCFKKFFSLQKDIKFLKFFTPYKLLPYLISRCTSKQPHTFAGEKNLVTKNNLLCETNDILWFRKSCTLIRKTNNFTYWTKVKIQKNPSCHYW